MKGNRLLLGLLLCGWSFAPGPMSGSTECVVYGSWEKEFAASTAVFEARVISVDWIPGRECCHVLSGWAILETDRWWKGKPVKRRKIAAVGQIFNVGEEYVVFGFGDPLVADGCNSTKLSKDSTKTLEWLSKKPTRRSG
jgi:hypothetical protein